MTTLALAGLGSCWRRGCTGSRTALNQARADKVPPMRGPTWPRTCTTRCCRPWP